jgi:hypothetical protein
MACGSPRSLRAGCGAGENRLSVLAQAFSTCRNWKLEPPQSQGGFSVRCDSGKDWAPDRETRFYAAQYARQQHPPSVPAPGACAAGTGLPLPPPPPLPFPGPPTSVRSSLDPGTRPPAARAHPSAHTSKEEEFKLRGRPRRRPVRPLCRGPQSHLPTQSREVEDAMAIVHPSSGSRLVLGARGRRHNRAPVTTSQ